LHFDFEICLETSAQTDRHRRVPLPFAFGVRLRDDSS
jgi:hypothetical protein